MTTIRMTKVRSGFQMLARVCLFAVLLLGVDYKQFLVVSARSPQQNEPARPLWLDVSIGPTFVPWFNQSAQANDIARIDHMNMVDLLEEITVGRRLMIFKSIADAERFLALQADNLEIVGYNLEHGPANPLEEQENPLESVKQMRALADRYGLQLALGPDHDFAISMGVEAAVYVDIMILQVQQVQTQPEVVQSFVLPTAQAMRQANPQIEIGVQISAEGDVQSLFDLTQSLQGALDGVSILTDHEDSTFVEAFAKQLRPTPTTPQSTATTLTNTAVMTSETSANPPIALATSALPNQGQARTIEVAPTATVSDPAINATTASASPTSNLPALEPDRTSSLPSVRTLIIPIAIMLIVSMLLSVIINFYLQKSNKGL